VGVAKSYVIDIDKGRRKGQSYIEQLEALLSSLANEQVATKQAIVMSQEPEVQPTPLHEPVKLALKHAMKKPAQVVTRSQAKIAREPTKALANTIDMVIVCDNNKRCTSDNQKRDHSPHLSSPQRSRGLSVVG
jgi:hypothetical protein